MSDSTTFTELHRLYEQPLLRYTRSLLRDPHDAADAAQDAWTRAFAALQSSPARVLSMRSWLFAIARNACMDRMREGRRCAPADIDERMLGASPAPDEVLELRARAREALGDLAGLSARQRAAVVLRDVNGLEGDELARALGIDARRASWLLTDARRSLAEVRSGRRLSCETTRRQLDSARVRTRAVRAHLAGCQECDGYARRRVGRRVHLHGIAIFVLALPARLRALGSESLAAAKPLGAIAAATLVAGVPAAHELSRDSGAHHARPAVAASTPHRHVAAAAPRVSLPAAPSARPHARVRAVAARPAAPHASSHAAAGHRAPAPAWRPAPYPSAQPAAVPLAPPAAPSLVRPVVNAAAGAVVATVPSAAPVVAAAAGTLDSVGADL
jgi:RNA polymerase sigma-70 factor, ECF subfamily